MAETLDLNRHEVEEIPGKMLELSGVHYVLQDRLAEGGEKYVYPIKNRRSGLILYLAKIYRFRPGSPEAEKAVTSLPWKVFDLVLPKLILYTEIHEVSGAVMELQPYGVDDNPEFHKPLMDRALALQGTKNWAEASELFDEILRHNQNHSMAMLNKAVAMVNLGEVEESILLVQQAIDIEPNFPNGYHLLSDLLLQAAGPKAALGPLKRALSRYNGDPVTWEKLLTTAVAYDMVEAAVEALREVYRLGSRPSGQRPQPFIHFEAEIEKSIERNKEYSGLLAKALEAQQKQSWKRALEICREAAQSSRNHGLALLNAFICQYHLGSGRAIAKELLGTLHHCEGMELAAAASLGILCADLANLEEETKRLALWIAKRFDHYVDIPGVPIGVSIAGALLEAKSGRAIIEVLRALEESCSPAEAKELGSLRRLYEERERRFV